MTTLTINEQVKSELHALKVLGIRVPKAAFKLADEDSKKAIWNHLLVLYNDYDPNNETISLLKKTLKGKNLKMEKEYFSTFKFKPKA